MLIPRNPAQPKQQLQENIAHSSQISCIKEQRGRKETKHPADLLLQGRSAQMPKLQQAHLRPKLQHCRRNLKFRRVKDALLLQLLPSPTTPLPSPRRSLPRRFDAGSQTAFVFRIPVSHRDAGYRAGLYVTSYKLCARGTCWGPLGNSSNLREIIKSYNKQQQ